MSLPSTKTFNGKKYKLIDAYPSKSLAKETAEDYRNQPQPTFLDVTEMDYYARVVDGGEEAGRLRYGVYVRQNIK